jgi:hypothetical protein
MLTIPMASEAPVLDELPTQRHNGQRHNGHADDWAVRAWHPALLIETFVRAASPHALPKAENVL